MSSRRPSHRHTSSRRRPPSDLPKTISIAPHHHSSSRSSSLPTKSSALLLLFSLVTLYQFTTLLHNPSSSSNSSRRSLLSTMYLSSSDHSTLLPWAHHNIVDVSTTPDPTVETALFWHIPKSGGTTAKRLYQCMGKTLAHRVGADPRFGHAEDKELKVFTPHAGKDWRVVNVDTTVRSGIVKAGKMGLVPSGSADLVCLYLLHSFYMLLLRVAHTHSFWNIILPYIHTDIHNGTGLCGGKTLRSGAPGTVFGLVSSSRRSGR
jgi:hypothetical protein